MIRATRFAALALAAVSAARAQRRPIAADGWRDTTHHTSGFVTVARGVQLHYLDFGGQGPPVLLLAGIGNTAHAFDDFAPRLTDHFHVIALTRRGFGESSHPRSGYDTPRLVDDIRTALDQLHLQRVSILGHSIAGEEMTRFAGLYPARVDKLVYLDAAYDRVAAQDMLHADFPIPPYVPARPQPTSADTATPAAYVAFVHRTRGVDIPESDIRTRYAYDGWNEEITNAYTSMSAQHPSYAKVKAPALAIYAVTDTVTQLEPWQRNAREYASAWQEIVNEVETVYAVSRAQFKREVAKGEVLEIHGAHHWIFVSNRDQVLSAVREFLSR